MAILGDTIGDKIILYNGNNLILGKTYGNQFYGYSFGSNTQQTIKKNKIKTLNIMGLTPTESKNIITYKTKKISIPKNINENEKFGYIKDGTMIYTDEIVDILFENQVYLNTDDLSILKEYDFGIHRNKEIYIIGPKITPEALDYILSKFLYYNYYTNLYVINIYNTEIYHTILKHQHVICNGMISTLPNSFNKPYIDTNLIQTVEINLNNSMIELHDNSFKYYNNVKSIKLTGSKEQFEIDFLFCYQPKLEELIIITNEDEKYYDSKEKYVIKNKRILYKYYPTIKDENFEIPNEIDEIANDCFCCNNFLTTITLPKNKKILFHSYSLELIPRIKKIEIPEGSEISINDNEKIYIPPYYNIDIKNIENIIEFMEYNKNVKFIF